MCLYNHYKAVRKKLKEAGIIDITNREADENWHAEEAESNEVDGNKKKI